MDYNLGCITQIPLGEGRNFLIGGLEIAVFHTRKGIYATQAECPHRHGPLADGLMGGTTIVCPFHAWKFDLTTGEPLMGQCAIRTYLVRLTASGEVMLTYDSTDPPSCAVMTGEDIGINQAEAGSATGPAMTA